MEIEVINRPEQSASKKKNHKRAIYYLEAISLRSPRICTEWQIEFGLHICNPECFKVVKLRGFTYLVDSMGREENLLNIYWCSRVCVGSGSGSLGCSEFQDLTENRCLNGFNTGVKRCVKVQKYLQIISTTCPLEGRISIGHMDTQSPW